MATASVGAPKEIENGLKSPPPARQLFVNGNPLTPPPYPVWGNKKIPSQFTTRDFFVTIYEVCNIKNLERNGI
jgi:hypothetical protein